MLVMLLFTPQPSRRISPRFNVNKWYQ